MYGVFLAIFSAVITLVPLSSQFTIAGTQCCGNKRELSIPWQSGWRSFNPVAYNSWSLQTRIPMTAEADRSVSRLSRMDIDVTDDEEEEGRGKGKFKKYKKYMLPLLLAYKLKFFTLIPVLIGGLVLLTGATGLAGFFFALFAATMGLKGGGDH